MVNKLLIYYYSLKIKKQHLESFVYLLQWQIHNNLNHPTEYEWFHYNFPVCKINVKNYLSLTNIILWDKLTQDEFFHLYKLYLNLDKFIHVLRNSSPWLSSNFGEKMEM